jgi:lipid-A-disaccharide synthase
MKIGVVAGEASGDLLGSQLISAIQAERSDIEFIGVAGPKMIALGAHSIFPMERLSVRGYVEVLKHLFGLLKLRKQLYRYLLQQKIDLFIGIDAPDFNFWLEKKFKAKGIQTIHYVSPSIWAWRKERIHQIKQCVQHVLCLFPFEVPLYQAEKIPASYIGHPLADMLPMEPETQAMRKQLKLKASALIIAMLPGSRMSEVEQHSALFLQVAKEIQQKIPSAVFLVPFVTLPTRRAFERAMAQCKEPINIKLLYGHAHDAMEASDVVLVASGTATLEAALLKKPMVITYRMPYLSWQILKRMRLQPYVGLPNILAGKMIVPEFLQDDATVKNISDAILQMQVDEDYVQKIRIEFSRLHQQLKQNSAKKAADIVLAHLIKK